MMIVSLQPDSEALWPPIGQISVQIERRGSQLWLQYSLFGEMSQVRWPESVDRERTEGLWKHTCLEAFVRTPTGYCEFNLAPSGQWASYRFDGYRKGMTLAPETVRLIVNDGRADYLDIGALFDLPPGADLMGISAVIEDVKGGLTYYAFHHAPGKPDFHHPDSFALVVPPPEPA